MPQLSKQYKREKNIMKLPIRLIIPSLCFATLIGCSAAMVPYTSDPERKLGWANVLLDEQNRPLPAERFIREAIAIYQSKNDEIGLGHAYRGYAYFYRSSSVTRWETFYREKGFGDKDVSFGQRFDKSIEYYFKARDIFSKANEFDILSSIDIGIAWASEAKGNLEMACKYLNSSLANNKQHMSTHPDTKVLMGNFKSYSDLIASEQKRMKCS
jgi:tetratricopeptide (TPR) repeat protein